MDLRKIKTLIDLVQQSGIGELEITEGEEKVRISRAGTGSGYMPGAGQYVQHRLASRTGQRRACRSGTSSRRGHRPHLEVTDGWHLLSLALAGFALVCRNRPISDQRPDALHHRSNEAFERDRVRCDRRGQSDFGRKRPTS